MKKLLFSLAAMVAMVATSCVQADVEDINLGGNEGVVTFVIKTDALGSRTGDAKINDGTKADKLVYGIYDSAWTLIKKDSTTMDVEDFGDAPCEEQDLQLRFLGSELGC